jgi:hypothetical protein
MGNFLRFTGSVLIGLCLAANPIALIVGLIGVAILTVAHNFDEGE